MVQIALQASSLECLFGLWNSRTTDLHDRAVCIGSCLLPGLGSKVQVAIPCKVQGYRHTRWWYVGVRVTGGCQKLCCLIHINPKKANCKCYDNCKHKGHVQCECRAWPLCVQSSKYLQFAFFGLSPCLSKTQQQSSLLWCLHRFDLVFDSGLLHIKYWLYFLD
jgi:hypothetical protein